MIQFCVVWSPIVIACTHRLPSTVLSFFFRSPLGAVDQTENAASKCRREYILSERSCWFRCSFIRSVCVCVGLLLNFVFFFFFHVICSVAGHFWRMLQCNLDTLFGCNWNKFITIGNPQWKCQHRNTSQFCQKEERRQMACRSVFVLNRHCHFNGIIQTICEYFFLSLFLLCNRFHLFLPAIWCYCYCYCYCCRSRCLDPKAKRATMYSVRQIERIVFHENWL